MITFDFSDLVRSMSRSLRFGRAIFHKGAKITFDLATLKVNVKDTQISEDLYLVKEPSQRQCHSELETLYLVKKQS